MKLLKNDYMTLILRLVLVYALLLLCRIVFYAMNAATLGAIAPNEWFSLLRGAWVFDTASVFYANALFVFFSLLPLQFRERKGYQRFLFWLYTLVNAVLVIGLNLADAIYFHYAQKRFTAEEFHFTGNDNNWVLIGKFILQYWHLALIAAVLIRGTVWVYRKIPYWKTPVRDPYIWTGCSVIALAAATALIIGGIRGGFTRQVRPITLSNAAQYATYRKSSLILSNPFCVIRTIGGTRIEVPDYYPADELESIFTPYHFPTVDSLNLGKRNVVIFTLESFSAEHSAFLNPDLYPDGAGYTPFLDSLMEQGYTFMNAYSNGRKSIDALPSILTSIPSYKTPFVLLPQSLGEVRGLPRLLGEEGYQTAFFCGSTHNSMGFAAFATLAGMEHIYMQEEFEEANGKDDFDDYWGIWDEPFLQYTARTIDTFEPPFFASVFTLSSHHPFVIPAQYKGRFRPGTTRIHQPVQYTDHALRRFFEYARQQEWFENTIFVFSADHVSSEIFAEKTKTPTGNNHIVLFLYTPDGALRGKEYRTAQQLDIMPTVLGLTDYHKPYFAFGRDVFGEPEREAVATNYINESYQYISDSIVLFSNGERTLSAYERSDTLQTRNIAPLAPPAQQSGERMLKAILQQYYRHLSEKSYVVPQNPTP
jgi:phosphoglycerol transferase MdoB-like AlkP superfamily enzyme